jgi:crossover junction endodeoxyribonuclease RuvC
VTIIGIDPGYAILGWSVIDNNLLLIDYGTINTGPDLAFDDRLLEIHKELLKIISRYRPNSAAIEKIYFSKNAKTALDVAKAIGVIRLTLTLSGLKIEEYTPVQVKQAITGFGKASKEQMQVMIKKIFKLKDIPRPDDAADALAIAACHSFRAGRK